MLILLIMSTATVAFLLAARFYAPVISRILGEKTDRITPAVTINDGRDYVPTRTPVVFAHHYASIAGAGPIIGPVIALIYGWGPALLWIILGGIFLGAVHDYVATYVAMREGGKNLTVIARRYIGKGAFIMLLILLIAILALVCAAFLDLSANALTSKVPVDALQLGPDQTFFRVQEGRAIIGGIASMSVVVITACSPLIGFLYLKRKWPVKLCSLLALAICGFSILIGLYFPMSVEPFTWKIMISGYVLISAGLPVWLFLQSRDFINVHILYFGIAFVVTALIAAAIRGGGQVANVNSIPMNNWAEGSRTFGPGWPLMFIAISCGAVSGFHSLCAGGTTCKQLQSEKAARHVGFYGMLLESFLAVSVICCLIVGLKMNNYMGYCYPDDPAIKPNAILAFAMAVGHTAHYGLGLPVAIGALGAMLMLEGFLVTTLDTAIRLTRYLIEEGWQMMFSNYDLFADDADLRHTDIELAGTEGIGVENVHPESPPSPNIIQTRGLTRASLTFLKYYWVNSGIAVGIMLLLALTNSYQAVWKIFGSANQLLAALALLIATTWLLKKRRFIWCTLLPAIFMLVTSITMLIRLLVTDYLPGVQNGTPGKLPLLTANIIVLAMTTGIIALILKCWKNNISEKE
ncbi:MAG: carbon starvation protein A [Phycisphaerae bacterium]|nr:carbon starvation protein A [Phycisphaerae bacterium]